MKNIWVYAALAVVLVLLAVFFILQVNSMSLALSAKGLETDEVCYIEEPFTDDGRQYAVLQTCTKDGALALVRAEKNVFGFWTLGTVKTDEQYVSLAWLKVADSSQRTDYRMQGDGRYEWHYISCGSDAIGNIELTNEQLPENVTVSIRQTGQEYTIHLICFNKDGFGDFSLRQTLIDNGFIAAV